jgi:hypothetical protein
MKTRVGDIWRVADIMQPCCSRKDIRIDANDRFQRLRLCRNTLHMSPPARKYSRQVLFADAPSLG